jgi:hypothetical protein
MKKLVLFVVLLMASLSIFACDFEFSMPDAKKSCKAGDELVLNVKLILNHRNCPIAIKDTKFKMDGVSMVAATDWKEVSPGVFTRQLKMKVNADNKQKISLSATRTCEKEGGYGIFTLPKQ